MKSANDYIIDIEETVEASQLLEPYVTEQCEQIRDTLRSAGIPARGVTLNCANGEPRSCSCSRQRRWMLHPEL